MKIQVRINEEGALRNQRHAFGNRFTLVSELLQNARRAGASLIRVDHDPQAQVLIVEDDGQGLDDFQKLLSFHESGWDADTCAQERPFGVGFSKCLYAATRCVVASGRRRVDIDTAAALARAAVEVEERGDAETISGTRVELHGVDLPDLAQRIEEMCAGFPVAVWFNGEPLRRPMAETHLATQASAIGSVHLAGTRDGRCTHDTWVFLQGLCVLRPIWTSQDDVNVVHLDPAQFMARLPERSNLLDEDVQRKRIDAELKACWRRTLEAAKAELPAECFVDRYYPALRRWGQLDLLNDMAILPLETCDAIAGYPVCSGHDVQRHLQKPPHAPTRRQVESGEVTLVVLEPVNESNGAHWMLARKKGWLVFDWTGVNLDHWAQGHVRFLDGRQAFVTPLAEILRSPFEGRRAGCPVVLCRSVHVQVGDQEALIGDEGVCHDGVIYIPDGEQSGRPAEQWSSYMDEHDRFLDADRDADRDALADLLRLLRAVDPVQTLHALLQSLRLGRYPLLHGKTFELTVGVGLAPGHTVGLVGQTDGMDTAAAGGAHAGR